jgi:hypothetical protein
MRAIAIIVLAGALAACSGERLPTLPPNPYVYLDVPDDIIGHDSWLQVLDDGEPAHFHWDVFGHPGADSTVIRIQVHEAEAGHEILIRTSAVRTLRSVIDDAWRPGTPALHEIWFCYTHALVAPDFAVAGDGRGEHARLHRNEIVEWDGCDPGPWITDYFADGSRIERWHQARELPEPYLPPKRLPPVIPPFVPPALVAGLILVALHRRRKRVVAIVA